MKHQCYDAPTNLFKADVSKPANSFTAASTARPSFTASSLLGAYGTKNVNSKLAAMLQCCI